MARSSLLPATAPFAEDDRASLNHMLGRATALQRAWLSGFLAGIEAQNDAPEVAPAAGPRPAEPLTILYASESGNAERLAGDWAKLARKAGFKPKVVDFADLDVATLAAERRLVVVAATWGEGEPPSRAARAYAALMDGAAPRLEGVTFAVLALGDRAYAGFCTIGRELDRRLAELGARRAVERVDCDLDFEAPAQAWITGTLAALAPPRSAAEDNVVAVDFAGRGAAAEVRTGPLTASVVEHVNLSSSRSDKQVIHLALDLAGTGLAYEPGDSLELFPENDPALVDQVLAAAGLGGDDGLRRLLLAERDVTTLTPGALLARADATGNSDLRAILAEGGGRPWMEGRQLIDLLEAFPARLARDELLGLTRPLPPRAYSIASSRREVGEEAHLLVAPVRYRSHGRDRAGVASTWVADRLKPGAEIRVRLKPNRHFRLPDPATDVIMVGPGTGVAPFRAFVQERRAAGATGRNWLVFGDRRFTHDFAYQLEWQDALADGSLARLDLAFSRDAPEKVYVQHRLWEGRRDLVAWLEGGAHLYVCGDAKAMAKDVRATLVRAYADVKGIAPDAAEALVAGLDRDRRYLQDVY